jgi:ketosteroid isomerase-like protein
VISEEKVERLRAFYAAVGRKDFDGIVQHLHPEVVIHPALGGELDFSDAYRGHEGMRAFMETAWTGFGTAVEADEMVGAPDGRVLATERWLIRARDGVEAEIELTDLYTFRDGLIIRIDGFRRKAEALEAAGLPND